MTQPDPDDLHMVEIDALLPAHSPRLAGHNEEHIRCLAESDALPPILVHYPSLRVIDGMHRLQAARLKGRRQIRVRYFEGSDEEAFVQAVRDNVAHGLPLSLADRRAAVARILTSSPQLSDRLVGRYAGLTARTVSEIRHRLEQESATVIAPTRLGLDGRVRPLVHGEGRARARQLIEEQPEASLREIARQAGISLGTAHAVRRELTEPRPSASAEPEPQPESQPQPEPEPEGQREAERDGADRTRPAVSTYVAAATTATPRSTLSSTVHDDISIVRRLARDPSLRQTSDGRTLLRSLQHAANGSSELSSLVPAAPVHTQPLIIEAVRRIGARWASIADELEREARMQRKTGS